MLNDILAPIQAAFASLWAEVLMFLPTIIIALLVLIVGWLLGGTLKRVIESVFQRMKVNEALDAAGVDALTERAGYTLRAGVFVGTLVKWFIIAVFFVAALDILQLHQVTTFVRDVVIGYLPNVIVAVLILLAASVLANGVSTVVTSAVRASRMGAPEMFGKISYYAIITFAILAVLNQLKIAPELVQMLFAGLVFALSLALGLAFGLGGRDTAARYLERVTKTKNDEL
jgi:small-conductance mechanosensitive channel